MNEQTDLSVLLDGVEERASRAAIFLYGGNVSNSESAKDVPALVDPKLELEASGARDAITAILQASSEPKVKEN